MTVRSVWRVPATGNIQNLRLDEDILLPLQAKEVRVAVKAIGLNFADIFAIMGLYSATPPAPFIPGLEFSGEIVEIGSEVTNVNIGDRVYGFTRFGAFATHVNVHSGFVRRLPASWSYDQGAAFLVQALTAYYGLVELGGLKANSNKAVLIQSAAGGVGLNALHITRALGAIPICVVGSASKVQLLEEDYRVPREHIIVRSSRTYAQDIQGALRSVDKDGYQVVMEAVGGQYFTDGYNALRPTGRMVFFGSATYMTPSDSASYVNLAWKYFRRPMVDPAQMIQENRGVLGFNLIWLTEQVDELNAIVDEMLARVDWESVAKPFVGRTFPFADIRDGIRFLQSGESLGKVVIQVNN